MNINTDKEATSSSAIYYSTAKWMAHLIINAKWLKIWVFKLKQLICLYGSILVKCKESLHQLLPHSVLQRKTSLDRNLNDKHKSFWTVEYNNGILWGNNSVGCWWVSLYLRFPPIIRGCGLLGVCVCTVCLLTCGNTTTEVSCGCDDIIHPAAMGIP